MRVRVKKGCVYFRRSRIGNLEYKWEFIENIEEIKIITSLSLM